MKYRKILIKIFSVLIVAFLYCEFLSYYVVLSRCSWPEMKYVNQNESVINVMLLADTHLLGPYRGHWFDKLRREWQMYRAFQSGINLYHPDVVFILGDLFDEGQWCNDVQFRDYIARFFSLFEVPSDTQMYVVPGNHDIGFHYNIQPNLVHRFETIFNISSVHFLNIKGNYFILINSMAMEGDSCYLCSEAEEKIMEIASNLKCLKNKTNCWKTTKLEHYSRPIILQHFPMYRKSDSECNESDEAPLEIKNELFREKWDCLSQKASELIYKELHPRVIFTGHVHHGCHIVHKGNIYEYTLPSFSWRNKNNPTFMLAKITPSRFAVKKCHMPKETTVVLIYISVVLMISIWIASIILLTKRFHPISGPTSVPILRCKTKLSPYSRK